MKVLVIGKEGQLARSLLRHGRETGDEIVLVGRPEIDLAEPQTLADAVAAAKPDVVINAAAHTAVDDAEGEPEKAMAVNGIGPGALAEACHRLDIPLIHVSTDYVFDGTAERAYREDDATSPIGVYGQSKLEGERRVVAAARKHVILRTAWVYSPWGKNFLKTMLRLGETRDEVSVVSDQIGCPTYAPHLAAACLAIAARVRDEPAGAPLWGIYHAAGSGETPWSGFARELFKQAEARGGRAVAVKPISTAEYPTRARRPANSRLDCGKLERVFGLRLPRWEVGTAECIDGIVRGE